MSNRVDIIKGIMAGLPKTDINTMYFREQGIMYEKNHEKSLAEMGNFVTEKLSHNAFQLVALSLQEEGEC